MKENFVAVEFNVNRNNDFTNTGKPYYFKAYDALNIDDVVVVDTKYGYQLGTVVEVNPDMPMDNAKKITKSVVCKVDFTEHYARMEKAERARLLKMQMDARIERLKENAVYEMMAEKDPGSRAAIEHGDVRDDLRAIVYDTRLHNNLPDDDLIQPGDIILVELEVPADAMGRR